MANKNKRREVQPGTVRAVFLDARELPIHFVDQVHVQAATDRLYVTFGQVNLPIIVGEPPADFHAEVRPVVRLVLTRADMERIQAVIGGVMAQTKSEEA